MNGLTKVMDPYASPAQGQHVHYLQTGKNETLCGLIKVRRVIYGQTVERHFLTVPDKPIKCVGCTRALEQVARMQLRSLTAEGIEKVLDLVSGMKNGYVK